MANADNPFGLKPIRRRGGTSYSGGGNIYHIDSAYASAIVPGDPVVKTGTASSSGIPNVSLATAGAGNAVTGVAVGKISQADLAVLQDAGVGSDASTEDFILVEDDPGVTFEIQATAGAAITDIGSNADLSSGAANSLDISGWELDSATYGTGATLQLKVLRVVQREDNEVGTNAKLEVLINNHTEANGTAGE